MSLLSLTCKIKSTCPHRIKDEVSCVNTCKLVSGMRLSQTPIPLLPHPSSSQGANGVTVKCRGFHQCLPQRGAPCRPLGSGARSGEASVPQDVFQPSGVWLSLSDPRHCCGTSRLLVPSNGKGSGGTRFILCLELKRPGGQQVHLCLTNLQGPGMCLHLVTCSLRAPSCWSRGA